MLMLPADAESRGQYTLRHEPDAWRTQQRGRQDLAAGVEATRAARTTVGRAPMGGPPVTQHLRKPITRMG
jgi:hypothetical protein